MKSCKGLFLLMLVFLVAVSGACRRNQPSLIDRNQAPETELWYVPADSTEYEYLVHIYWRGSDRDGTVVKYIWTITDTIAADAERRWNPAERISDYRLGRLTTRTDSIFAFTAFKNVGGVGLKKSLQAFHISAIDDNGVIDVTPAAIEFVATIDKLPEIRFSTDIDLFYKDQREARDPRPYNRASLDTVPMYRDFSIGYHGYTTNGLVRALKWYPISNVELRGKNLWTADLTDSTQYFVNDPDSLAWFQSLTSDEIRTLKIPLWRHYELLPSGIFRFAAQCIDDAKAESQVDAGQFTRGVCQVVINHDPDTEIFDLMNIYKVGEVYDTVHIDFSDGTPDTVPFRSWISLSYRGWDNPRDVQLCEDDFNKCIKYQIQYLVLSERFPELNFNTGLLPGEGPQDTNPCGIADSTSMNIGTAEYEIRVRAVDENGKPDGMPEIAHIGGGIKTAVVNIVGNYDPTLDSLSMLDHLNRRVSYGDTIKWKWSEGISGLTPDFTRLTKTFSFRILGWGHDHPKELMNAGVKSWYYNFTSLAPTGITKQFARGGSWVNGSTTNQLDDKFQVVFVHDFADPFGDQIFNNPPSWVGLDYGARNDAYLYEMVLRGRDTFIGESFKEEIFLRNPNLNQGDFVCPPDPNIPISVRTTQNDYPTARYGRWTGERAFRFYFQLVDDRG